MRRDLYVWLRIGGMHSTISVLLAQFLQIWVQHNFFLAKLAAYGVAPVSLPLLHCYLRDRSQRVRIEDVTSEVVVFSKGVPQGSVLGPLLFNIFLNALFYFINCANLLFVRAQIEELWGARKLSCCPAIITPREHRKPQKSRGKIRLSTGTLFLHTGVLSASHITDLFTNSCDHIYTNGKAPLHSYINLQHYDYMIGRLTF